MSLSYRGLKITPSIELPNRNLSTLVVQVPDAKLKYQQLLFAGKKLAPLPTAQHTDDNKVRGCVSQVSIWGEVALVGLTPED